MRLRAWSLGGPDGGAVVGAGSTSGTVGVALERSEHRAVRNARGIVPQRIRWWKKKLEGSASASRKSTALLPVRIVGAAEPSRGTPVQVILPSGHIVRVGRGFDEDTFARVMAIPGGR